MNQEHYLKYAVYNNSKTDYLVKAESGYFASEAWMKGDEEYSQITGSKFGGIFGDDGKDGWVDKHNIRRLTSDEEFDKLYESSCLYFKVMLLVLDMLVKVHCEHRNAIEAAGIPTEVTLPDGMTKFTEEGSRMIKEYHKIHEFKMYAIPWFDDLGIDHIPDEDYLREMAEAVLK